jgi:hypothetical protein
MEVRIDKRPPLADIEGMTSDALATLATILIMAGLAMLMLDAVLDRD